MSQPPTPVHVPAEDLKGRSPSEIMSIVSRAMWEAGVEETDVTRFCQEVTAAGAEQAEQIVASWVTLT